MTTQFGTGSRTCLGKNISLLEMSKLVPQILRQFNVKLADPAAEWHLADYWFVKQTGLICRVRDRCMLMKGKMKGMTSEN
jgi:cytochrome P450